MGWLPFGRKKKENFTTFIKEKMKEFEKPPFKAVFIYNDQWLPLYGYKDENYFDGEFQEVLRVIEEASGALEKNLTSTALNLAKKNLKYSTPFLAFRYGTFTVMGLREKELFLVAVVEEFNGRADIDKIERKLRETLQRVGERERKNNK